jgi:hypothetical protein
MQQLEIPFTRARIHSAKKVLASRIPSVSFKPTMFLPIHFCLQNELMACFVALSVPSGFCPRASVWAPHSYTFLNVLDYVYCSPAPDNLGRQVGHMSGIV